LRFQKHNGQSLKLLRTCKTPKGTQFVNEQRNDSYLDLDAMVTMMRGGCVGWTAGWDLLTIFRQTRSCGGRWWQQETRCKCLVPQRHRHVGHLHQISPVCRAATAAPAAAAAVPIPWDHHCCEDCQAQEQQEPYQMPAAGTAKCQANKYVPEFVSE